MPGDWSTAIFCPIYKNGDKTECKNYREISLLSTPYKILAKIVANRLTPYMENTVGDYQCGFRERRSTIDQIFSFRTILEKCYEFSVNLYILFIDFKQAYDSIYRNKLYETLYKFEIPGKLIRLVSMSLTNKKGKVAV
jgi:sorting nexin-29